MSESSARAVFKNNKEAAFLLLPTVAVCILFLYYPAIDTFRLSLYQTTLVDESFAGLYNYTRLFASESYRNSLFVTFGFAGVVVFGTMLISLIIAFMMYEVNTGTSVYLITAIWPYALPPAVAGLVLLFLLQPDLGIFTYYIRAIGSVFGYDIQFNWRRNGPLAFAVVSVAAIWKQLGYNIIFMIAALNNIPKTIHEAAELDGVSRLNRLFRIYVPLMSPTLVFLIVINTIYAFFATFPLIDLMTQGGPGGATNILIFNLYIDAFENFNLGYASAQSLVLFLLVGVLMYVQLRVSDRYAHYGG
ncbi:carbohydrate ABC transporter permease [Natrialbaceae archaeon A-CW2]|uniref:carbohydrate ABC transporter permease n=1 Tax=Natronosalvus amylolyticus TaxID=2961994 RepID=UPI0020C9E03B|nr:sugar ABC transporter permease [Natronosalvus amylolyticus]